MSVRSAWKDPKLALALSPFPSLSSEQVLTAHLLHEVAKGRKSMWYPYLLHLPRVHHTLAHFSSLEAQALQVEDAMGIAEWAAKKAHRDWKETQPLIEKLGLVHRFALLQAWLWASATVSSRTLFVPWDEAGTLCPVGDFFNYAPPGQSSVDPASVITTKDPQAAGKASNLGVTSSSSDAGGVNSQPEMVLAQEKGNDGNFPGQNSFSGGEWEADLDNGAGVEVCERLRDGGFEAECGEYCFYARENYRKGQQVLLCYGEYTNLELLEHYGFLLPNNPNDRVHLGLPDPCELGSVKSFHLGDGSLSCQPFLLKDLYINVDGRPSFSLLGSLRLQAAPLSLRKSRGHLAFSGLQLSRESDVAIYQWLIKKCQTILTSFPTGIEEDQILVRLIGDCQSAETLSKLWDLIVSQDYKGSEPSCPLLEEWESISKEVQAKILDELQKFKALSSAEGKISRGRVFHAGDPKFERWKLAVQWRLGYKKILDRSISHSLRRLDHLRNSSVN